MERVKLTAKQINAWFPSGNTAAHIVQIVMHTEPDCRIILFIFQHGSFNPRLYTDRQGTNYDSFKLIPVAPTLPLATFSAMTQSLAIWLPATGSFTSALMFPLFSPTSNCYFF